MHVGQQVVVKIPAEAVLLGMAGTWPGSDRWNRWGGRIVLVEPGISSPMITVKLHGKSWTLKSTGPVVGHSLRPQAWEPVNIVIDPETVMLVPQVSAHAVRNRSTAASTRTIAGDRVWLRARIEAVRVVESGSILSLDVGGAPVSALVCRGQEAPRDWAPGLPVEIHVGQWEAWLKPHGDGGGPVFCRLSY